jgi:hypothetical protein
MKAYSLIRRGPEYRSEAFAAGLRACGYRFVEGWNGQVPAREDVLIIWNRYGLGEAAAEIFEKAGAAVLVAENGYIGRDAQGQQLYALARGGHNGSGSWHEGPEDRLAALGLQLKPWLGESQARHILVCGQRGIGSALMASPPNWHFDMAEKLRPLTTREVRVRPHPETRGLGVKLPELARDLENCWAVVIWSSNCGVRALVEGVPVFYAAPRWSAAAAALRITDAAQALQCPMTSDEMRLAALRSVAWQQWTLAEIADGLPFRYLLGHPVSVAA